MNSRERFEETFSVVSCETDISGNLSLYSLFNRFQELAGVHATYLDVGYETLQKAKLAWVLSRIKVQIHLLPRWGETVRLATWPKGIDRLFALRDFSMINAQNEPLVHTTSGWLLVDIERGRPRKIETLPIDLQFPLAQHALQDPLDKISVPTGLVRVFEKPIWPSDIDINRHVNNAQYAKWVADCFSHDQFHQRRITSIQINYLEETMLGDTITLFKVPIDLSSSEYFICGTSRIKGSTVFHARVQWT
jgi:medium-chain acyl-[acyl-carrier-protein] hydrolase